MANQLQNWNEANPYLVARGIDESTWNALCTTIYPGARADSIVMAVDYCHARKLDIMLKPVHLVPMQVKDAQTGQKSWRDVPMPGVGLYRIQASRSGDYAGADEPEFGPTVEREFKGENETVIVAYPEWCKYTVHKLIGDRIVAFSAKEYWLENYATAGSKTESPNAMWKKRPYAQLAKCAEAQALRRAWPEIGQEPTAEEMEGKSFMREERDITPVKSEPAALPTYTQEQFLENANTWANSITAGKATPEKILAMISTKYTVPADIQEQIRNLTNEEPA